MKLSYRFQFTQLFFLVTLLIHSAASFAQNNEHPSIDRFEADISIAERMEYYGVPGMSIAVIRDGKILWAKGYGVLQAGKNEPINTETVFSVGSVSKVGTAVTALRLVQQGQLELDRNVNDYLTKWQVPENQYTRRQPVTLRRIMSHTAGLTVHGFADFQPGERLPSTVQILEGSGPAKNRPIRVDIPIGSRFRYSGGGTTVEQLMIEEVTDKAFPEAVGGLVFRPLNMSRSSYQNPLPASHGNIAKAHDRNGNPRALPRGYEAMPEAGASGLWTTPSDIAKMLIAVMDSHAGDSKFLSKEIVADMMSPVSPSEYGLGPRLSNQRGQTRFSHGGANDSYRAHFEGYLESKSGLVILTNGNRGTELIREIRESLLKTGKFE